MCIVFYRSSLVIMVFECRLQPQQWNPSRFRCQAHTHTHTYTHTPAHTHTHTHTHLGELNVLAHAGERTCAQARGHASEMATRRGTVRTEHVGQSMWARACVGTARCFTLQQHCYVYNTE